jgi:hypothetical protein
MFHVLHLCFLSHLSDVPNLSKSKDTEKVYQLRSPEYSMKMVVHRHDPELELLQKAIKESVETNGAAGEASASHQLTTKVKDSGAQRKVPLEFTSTSVLCTVVVCFYLVFQLRLLPPLQRILVSYPTRGGLSTISGWREKCVATQELG